MFSKREILTAADLGGLRRRDRLPQHGVQLDDLLMLNAAHVRSVGVGAGASDIAQLTAQRGASCRTAAGRRGACRRQLDCRLLLLMLLPLQMLFVGLRAGARDSTHVAVVQLLRLGRGLGPPRCARTHTALVVVLPPPATTTRQTIRNL